jgi:thioesterase domain-containing protein
MSDERLSGIENFLHEQIPLTRAMGVRVAEWDGARLVVTAPLEPNHNHLGTAFGGSLAAIATLAGYGLLWLALGDRSAHIVIRSSTMNYRAPVRRSIRAVCVKPDDVAMTEFREKFHRAGKARITLRVVIEEDGATCVEFEGVFVALR